MARKYLKLEPSLDAAKAALGWIRCTTEMATGEGVNRKTDPLSYDTFGGDGAEGVEGTPPAQIIANFGRHIAGLTAAAAGGDKDAIEAAITEYDCWVYGKDLGARSAAKSGGDSPIMAVQGKPGFKQNYFNGDHIDPKGKVVTTVPLDKVLNAINLGRQQAEAVMGALPKALEIATAQHLASGKVMRDPSGNLVLAPAGSAPPVAPAKPAKVTGRGASK